MSGDTLIIIQARTGSTRLPEKTIRPFFGEKCLLTLMCERLLTVFGKDQIVLATTVHPGDDRLVELAAVLGIRTYRGSEPDVLQRFIEAAKTFGGKTIVRVCADNPFLFPEFIAELLDAFFAAPCDYVSFATAEAVPVIRTHWGLFTEVTTTAALEKAAQQTQDAFYHEHVTNFIYGHPEKFSVKLLPLPEIFKNKNGFRFTLDTPEDFELLRNLYLNLFRKHHTSFFTPEQLMDYMEQEGASFREEMQKQIERNAK